MIRAPASLIAALVGLALGACGFSGAGGLDGADGADGGSPPSAAPDAGDPLVPEASTPDGAPVVPIPICNPPACALPVPPAGWNLVLLASTLGDACPTGFESTDAIESPVAGPSACACAACIKTGTNCSTGAIPTAYDTGGGGCGISGAQHQTNGGACRSQSGTFGQNARVDAPTAVLGTCTSAASGVPANVTSQARRVCRLESSACSDRACGVPASMQACIASPGDVACPVSAPQKHLVGSDVALQCPGCACTITSATCGGTLDFYPQSNCGGTPVSLLVGACKATGGASFVSTKWKPLIASEQCSTVPAAPKVTLTAAQTVCCP